MGDPLEPVPNSATMSPPASSNPPLKIMNLGTLLTSNLPESNSDQCSQICGIRAQIGATAASRTRQGRSESFRRVEGGPGRSTYNPTLDILSLNPVGQVAERRKFIATKYWGESDPLHKKMSENVRKCQKMSENVRKNVRKCQKTCKQ